ncbi:MAG: hypothetical protein J5598_02800, partial [Clostridia bacterium]|nr:hypothetical protein [Clostridia bacterium]
LHGVSVNKGEIITLPQIIEDEDGNKFWEGALFGNYRIRGWLIANDDWILADDTDSDDWYQSFYQLNMITTRDLTFVADLEETYDSVECVFLDDQGKQISYSGLLADGAEAYMALSGMDAEKIKNFGDGYQKWVEESGDMPLEASTTGESIKFNLGAETVNEPEPEDESEENNEDNGNNNDLIKMFIILGVGAFAIITLLSVYLVIRKKNRPAKAGKFKEEI